MSRPPGLAVQRPHSIPSSPPPGPVLVLGQRMGWQGPSAPGVQCPRMFITALFAHRLPHSLELLKSWNQVLFTFSSSMASSTE